MIVDQNRYHRVQQVSELQLSDAAARDKKFIGLIKEAASNDAQIIVFPEVFMPGYPNHIWLDSPFAGMEKFAVSYREQPLPIDCQLIFCSQMQCVQTQSPL